MKGKTSRWPAILDFEQDVGWKPRSNLGHSYLDQIGDPCSVETDGEGWPGKWSFLESDIVVYGDSFAFGYGVKAKRAFYSILEDTKIKPIGAPGYNMVQELILMKKYSPQLRGKIVVWFIFIGNDLRDNLVPFMPMTHYTMPFLVNREESGSWEICSDHVRPEKWAFASDDTNAKISVSNLCTSSKYSERVFSAARYLITEANEVCDAAGANLVVFSIPDKRMLSVGGREKLRMELGGDQVFDPRLPERELASICDEVGVKLECGSSLLNASDYKIRDGHWNERGHQKVGGMLMKYHSGFSSKEIERGYPSGPLVPETV